MTIPNLVSLRGIPLPSPACLRRVKAKDPTLGVIYVEGMLGGYWALTQQWRDGDPRYKYIRSGEIAADKNFDVKHIFKRDMPMESIAAYVEAFWAPRGGKNSSQTPVEDAEKQLALQQKVKADMKEHNMNVFLEKQEQQVKDLTDHQRRLSVGADTAHPMVHGFGDHPTVGRRGKKRGDAEPGGL